MENQITFLINYFTIENLSLARRNELHKKVTKPWLAKEKTYILLIDLDPYIFVVMLVVMLL